MNEIEIQWLTNLWAKLKPWADSMPKESIRQILAWRPLFGIPARSLFAYQNLIPPTSAGKTPLHMHGFYELIYCCSDSGMQYLLNSDYYYLQRGDIIFIPPQCPHQPLPQENLSEPFRQNIFWMSADFPSAFAELMPQDELSEYDFFAETPAGVYHTSGNSRKILAEYFMSNALEGKLQILISNSSISVGMLRFMKQLKETLQVQQQSHKKSFSKQVISYIDEHLQEKITLSDTARHFLISESTLSQIFRKETGTSFYQYVICHRLDVAKKLILQDVPLEDIAMRTGFSDYSAFYRSFKKEVGISPRQFRKVQDI